MYKKELGLYYFRVLVYVDTKNSWENQPCHRYTNHCFTFHVCFFNVLIHKHTIKSSKIDAYFDPFSFLC